MALKAESWAYEDTSCVIHLFLPAEALSSVHAEAPTAEIFRQREEIDGMNGNCKRPNAIATSMRRR